MRKKEEFPTFLNEQPTIIFGRTGRELMVMACGLAATYSVWQSLHKYFTGPALTIVAVALACLPMLLSVFIALISIAKRPLEEWFFIWLLYVVTPKLYLCMLPQEEEDSAESKMEENIQEQQLQLQAQDEDSEED